MDIDSRINDQTIRGEWVIPGRLMLMHMQGSPTQNITLLNGLVEHHFDVLVTMADVDYSLSWRAYQNVPLRHYQCAFSGKPTPNAWDLIQLHEYLLYELTHGRRLALWFENSVVEDQVRDSFGMFFPSPGEDITTWAHQKMASQAFRIRNIPSWLTHCSGCREKGCLTELVCHVTAPAEAVEILRSGCLLSACRMSGKSGVVLAADPHNVSFDPPDYFEYIMFTFGNCTAGDRLVMERALGRLPTDEDLTRRFRAGVRFYFRYHDLAAQPNFCTDGYHLSKIKDQLEIAPLLVAVVAPHWVREILKREAPPALKERLVFIEQDEEDDLWSWSHKAYLAVFAL